MPKGLNITFLVHAIVSLIGGLVLLIFPGRFLQALGWAPIDPIISRMYGAALLALSWSSYRGWRATRREQVAILVELEAALCVLVSVGILRHLIGARWPLMVWLLLAIYVGWAIVWIFWLVRKD
jgi:hypothetical protein